jgi:hypothetical protein
MIHINLINDLNSELESITIGNEEPILINSFQESDKNIILAFTEFVINSLDSESVYLIISKEIDLNISLNFSSFESNDYEYISLIDYPYVEDKAVIDNFLSLI